VGKWWSVLFAVVMIASGGLFVVAPFVDRWWLPQSVSTHGADVDRLFYIILGITGFFFILTEALLVTFMWRFAHQPGEFKPHAFGHHADVKKVFWTTFFKRIFRPVSAVLHNQHRVELAWTLVPAAILLYIAFAQVNTWAVAKYKSRMPQVEELPADQVPQQVEISARQFEWRMRYPSPARWDTWRHPEKHNELTPAQILQDMRSFGRAPQPDDVHVVNELHVWTDSRLGRDAQAQQFPAVVMHLRTIDVIHSLNLPYMRVKQDALPGKVIPVWFRPTKYNTIYHSKTERWVDGYNPDTNETGDRHQVWEIPCAELCGWGHYRMIGRVYVHEDEEHFLQWLRATAARTQSTERDLKTIVK
jgi:cytochrome c oxidase subunit 2